MCVCVCVSEREREREREGLRDRERWGEKTGKHTKELKGREGEGKEGVHREMALEWDKQ